MQTFLCAIALYNLLFFANAANDDFRKRLQDADKAASTAMDGIFKTWEVDNYPNFLTSAWIPKNSWDHLVKKFEQKILLAEKLSSTVNFTMSFTGSSVTAGHDSMFTESFSVLIGDIMGPVLRALNVLVVSRNVAMGNNHCMPYDACVKTFAGLDADLVHWEQSYNCFLDLNGDPRDVEQFLRQALYIPAGPMVVYAHSPTPNWKEGECASVKPYNKTTDDKELLILAKSGIPGLTKIFTESNKKYFTQAPLHSFIKTYPFAAVQIWDHSRYLAYKCLGPYIPSWGIGCRSWHPSVSGHKLRAHHHAYVWLTAWREAVMNINNMKDKESVQGILSSVEAKLTAMKVPATLPPRISHSDGDILDNVQCFTQFEPHADRTMALSDIVVSGLSTGSVSRGWALGDMDEHADMDMFSKRAIKGYLDRRAMIQGNKSSGALSLKIDVKKAGVLRICQAPGNWGIFHLFIVF